MVIPLLAMVAFSVDLGWLVTVQTELQNSADAAALAGTQKLMDPYVQWALPGVSATQQNQIRNQAIADAKAAAKQYAGFNQAGGVPLTLNDNDIEVGYTDQQGNYNPNPDLTVFPNTVAVTVRRDDLANGQVSLFFAPVLGTNAVPLSAYARAATFAGNVQSLKALPNTDAHILPVALDVNVWNQFYATGKSPDGNIYNSPLNGLPQLQVYPWGTNTPGSFGLLDTGPPANNVPAFRTWINDGQTPNDINYLLHNELLPVSPQAAKPWKCGPGLKSTLQIDFASQINVPVLIPIFQPVSTAPYVAATAQGQGATYAIIGFVGVKVTQATGSGSSMNISIQPAANVDPTAVIPNATPGGSTNSGLGGSSGGLSVGGINLLGGANSGTPPTTFTSPKLVQ
jgi:Flp pilus assembly protein TadG